MNPFPNVQADDRRGPAQEADMLALAAITQMATDSTLLSRFLDLSGISIAELKAGLGTAPVQRAALDFLANHEPDLIACADAIGCRPEQLMSARDQL